MEIELLVKEILPPLQDVINVVEKKHNLPILSHVLITVNNNELSIIATDLEIQIEAKSKIKSDKDFKFTVYAKNLIDIIKYLDKEQLVVFKVTTKKITITINEYKYELNTFASNNFPLLKQSAIKNKKKDSISVSANKLKNLINNISFTIANQDIRIYFNGLYFEANAKELTLVATDGHRLSKGTIEQLNKNIDKKTAILPKKAVNELIKTTSKTTKDKIININITNNYFNTEFDNINLTSQLINATFPEYEEIIPKESNIIKVELGPFISALRNVVPLVDDKKKNVKILFSNNNIDIYTESERGKAHTKINITKQHNNLEVIFNINYLMDILDKINDKYVRINIPSKNKKSYLFTSDKKDNCKYIVMPMTV